MIILEKLLPDKAIIWDGNEKKIISPTELDGCIEGDVIILRNGKYITDTEATAQRKSEILNLQNSLWE